MKAIKTKKTNTLTPNADRIICVGNRGTAFSLAPKDAFPLGEDVTPRFPSPSSAGISFQDMGAMHGQGRPCGIASYDAALFVSSGAPARLYRLSEALKAGHVQELAVTFNGTPATVFLSAGWKTGQKLPKFMATHDLKAGRVETRLISLDERNKPYVRQVRLALVSTPTPTPAAKGKGTTPAKSKGTPAAKPAKLKK